MLSAKEQEWIAKRKARWQILLDLRDRKISIISAEKKLRELDSK